MSNNLTFDKKSITNQSAFLMLAKVFNTNFPKYKKTSELICTVYQLTGSHKLWKNWD